MQNSGGPPFRRGKKRPLSPYNERGTSPPLGLEVVGRHALLFDDDSTAAFINSQDALLAWNGDQKLVLDRYDVRHLLQDLSGLRRKRVPQPNFDVTEEDLDLERYRDLDYSDDPPSSDSQETSKRQKSAGGGYQSVPFSYGVEETSTGERKSDDGVERSDFNPPFSVPDSLHNNLPPTEKIHQIIARTAKFVSEHGGQSEIVLRVKQGNNPVFGFLMPDHHLHIYFRFLVDHPELLGADKEDKTKQPVKNTIPGEGLSLLGSVYGTGDDEDEGTVRPSTDTREEDSPIQDHSVGATFSVDSGMVLDRAESSTLKDIQGDICSTHPHTSSNRDAPTTDKQSAVLECSRRTSTDNSVANLLHSQDVAGKELLPFPVQTSEDQTIKGNASIVEPPSFLKRIVQKMVEFIIRNGKEFEAIVINQDKTNGRFPFLLPTNQYHSYYLKVLEEVQQAKLKKGFTFEKFSPRADAVQNEVQETSQKSERNIVHGYTGEDDTSVSKKTSDAEKKTKFKIVIGGIKKDSHDHGNGNCGKQSGMTSEAAASAVQAATKRSANFCGFSQGKTEAEKCEKKECGMSADAAAAIVMAATRGLRRHKQGMPSESGAVHGRMLGKILKSISEDSEGIGSAAVSISQGDVSHHNSSNGGLVFPQSGHNSVASGSSSKLIDDDELPRAQSVDISGASGFVLKLDDPSIGKDEGSVAKVMAKAAALAAAREADSSEACLSREEKLKAERLKRAKMFAALIKSGHHIVDGNDVQSCPPTGTASVQHETGSKATACGSSHNAASTQSGHAKEGTVSNDSARGEESGQTKVISVSKDYNNKSSKKEVGRERHSDHHRHHKRSKSHHDKCKDKNEDYENRERRYKHNTDKDHKHSISSERHARRKHYDGNILRLSEDEHRRHRHRSISKDRDSAKRHDHYDPKEDGYRHKNKDRSGHKHQKKSHSNREPESRDDTIETKGRENLKNIEMSAPEASQSASHPTEAPDDLRAKVRAMLLANL